jgi:hypothetical protein
MTAAAVVAVAAGVLGEHGGDVLDRVGGVLGGAARAACEWPKAERAAAVAACRAPVPASLAHVHPSWVEAALADLPERARAVVARDVALDEVAVWLGRWACAELPATGAAEIRAWLEGVGADQLAFALGHPADAVMRSLRAAAERIASPPRLGNLGARRAAIIRCRVAADDELALVRIAARAIAPHLAADPLARRLVAVALPRPDGQAIYAELLTHAFDATADAPQREALVGWPLG